MAKLPENHQSPRSVLLSLGALEAIKALHIYPSIVSGHDWMCAPLMAHLNSQGSPYKTGSALRSG